MGFFLIICSLWVVAFVQGALGNTLGKEIEYKMATSTCPEIVSRDQWGAKPPKDRQNMTMPVSYVLIHHTAMPSCGTFDDCCDMMRRIQRFHQEDRGWSDIGYQFLIGEDGRVYEGRGWSTVGAQSPGWNTNSIGVSFMGNFMEVTPNVAAMTALKQLITCGIDKGMVTPKYTMMGHRQSQKPGYTDCPGDQLLCCISKWPNWEPYQKEGTFKLPTCKNPDTDCLSDGAMEVVTNGNEAGNSNTTNQSGSLMSQIGVTMVTAIAALGFILTLL